MAYALAGLSLLLHGVMWAQGSATMTTDATTQAQTAPPGRLILVLPFDNHSGDGALDWVGDSFPDTLNQRLTSAGFLTITREDREYALDHLGLPAGFRPTRATTLRIAQTLDADYVVVGSYTVSSGKLQVQAQVIRVNQLRMSAPIGDASDLARLYDVENATAWKIAREIDPQFAVAEQTFLAASAGVPLSAFENYIRGVEATSQQERLKRLSAAVAESPTYTQAMLGLGKAQFAARDYDHAAMTLAKVRAVPALCPGTGGAGAGDAGFAPLERIRRTYSEASFRQAAFQLDQMRQVRMTTMKPAERAVEYTEQGRTYLAEGLLPEAEQEFQLALTADGGSAPARLGLAEVREQSGDDLRARSEADQALALRPLADAHVLLGRLDLKANRLPDATDEVKKALQLEPKNTAAVGLRQALVARGQTIP